MTQQEEEYKAAVEHRDALNDIQAVLATGHGKNFIRYLFKSFEVGECPPFGLTGEILHDKLGFLRAGGSLFDIVCEASPAIAGDILANIRREKNAKIYQDDADERNADGRGQY